LLIRAGEKTLSQVSEVITAIDSNSPQVMIESQVFEFDDTVSRQIGTAIEYGHKTSDYNYAITTTFGEGITNALPSFFKTLNDAGKKQSLLFNIAMQDKNGSVKILSEPRLVLKPGTKGEINLETIKYVIVAGVNDSELEQIPTGITFGITPTILSENTILLDIDLKQSEFIPSNETDIVQSVNSNTIKTSVVVQDGELISIGGIYLDKQSKFNSGIPFLKDIPIAGHLFGSTNNETSRVMIEFMIKPTIKKLRSALTDRTKSVLQIQSQHAKE
ncbi:MAG: hypothetical protein GQ547_08725, partial [Methylophaga sp.]|nr:hypothetical protein [Methylophaga sp.]